MSRTAQRVSQYSTKNYTPAIQASSDNQSVGSAAGNSAQVTVPAGGAIGGIVWSYSGPVTTGGYNISDSSGTLVQMDIHAGSGQNFGTFDFTPPISSQISTSVLTITLTGATSGGSASIANQTGKLNVQAWTEY